MYSTTQLLGALNMTIQIKDLTVCEEIDMTAVRGGEDCNHGCGPLSVGTFTDLVNQGNLSPYDLISLASRVDLTMGGDYGSYD
jgi:hypothetical protein